MGNNPERGLKRLRRSIRKLESSLATLPGADIRFLMRVCREELAEKAVEVAALPGDYPRSELFMTRHLVRIFSDRHVLSEPSEEPPETPAPEKSLSTAELCLLARELGLSGREESLSWLYGGKIKASPKKLAAVKRCLKSLGIKRAEVSIKGRKVYISAGKNDIVKAARLLDRIQKKIRSLGFSAVSLTLAS